MSIVNATIGQELTPLVKSPIEQELLNRYAVASGDRNPIHLDQAAAQRVGLPGIIAHGMLSMAFLGQFVNQQIAGVSEARVGKLKVRYVGMVRVGDTLTCLGKVKERTEEAHSVALTFECWAQNQRGEQVTLAEAVVHVPQSAK